MSYIELTDEQRRVYIDVLQAYEALEEARARADHYKGYMTWKRSKGKEYLFKGRSGARGVGTSLGLRTSETEAQYDAFYKGKETETNRVKSLQEQVSLKSKYASANRLNRMPREAAQVCRVLNTAGCSFTVVGSNALYGYEVLAGIHFSSDVVATGDLDLLLDTRERLKLSTDEDSTTFIELLRKSDKSFSVSDRQSFRAINDKGYMVDLITAPKSPQHLPNEFATTLSEDLDIAEIEKLEWLVSAPYINCYPIAQDGVPVRMKVPDPRAFAIHKFFVGQQQSRDPVKKHRDQTQARLLMGILAGYLPSMPLTDEVLRNFPATLRDEFLRLHGVGQGEPLW